MTWYNPPKGADLSPIENAWSWMANAVYRDKPSYKTVEELEEANFQSWNDMPQSYIDSLINSMPRRMLQVVERKGEYIDY